MRVHSLNCGTFCPMAARLINGRGSLFERGRLVCHCLLIETDVGLVLVDTGLGTGDIAQPMQRLPGRLWQIINQAQLRMEETAIRQVEAMGFDAEDVRHIVLTHLDFDHAGGLADFPHAQVHVLGVEHEQAMHPQTFMDKRRYARPQFAHHPHWVLHGLHGERWMGFEAVSTIAERGMSPEVLLVPLPGHTRGHCGVAVNTPHGWLLHAGDAVFHHAEFNPLLRRSPIGLRVYQNVFQYDRQERLANQRRLRELAAEHSADVRIICSHDPELFDPVAEPIRMREQVRTP